MIFFFTSDIIKSANIGMIKVSVKNNFFKKFTLYNLQSFLDML